VKLLARPSGGAMGSVIQGINQTLAVEIQNAELMKITLLNPSWLSVIGSVGKG
jgi:hypothetical protein